VKYRITADHQKAEKLLKKLKLPERVVRHSEKVAANASALYAKFHEDENEMKSVYIAGLLHDVGKAINVGLHELNTQSILAACNLSRYARYTMHGFVYERLRGENEELASKYLPNSLENKCVVLADMQTGPNGEEFTVEQRFTEIMQRYNDDRYFMQILMEAKSRMLNLELELLEHQSK